MFVHLIVVQAPRVELPKAAWTRWFYGDRRHPSTTHDLIRRAGLPELHKTLLPKGEVEVRLWSGFSWGVHCIVLHFRNGRWTARQLDDGGSGWDRLHPRTEPRGGWKSFWSRAESLGIYTLPDESALGISKEKIIFDVSHEIVEVERNGTYRAYHYYAAGYKPHTREERQMSGLQSLTREAFGPPQD